MPREWWVISHYSSGAAPQVHGPYLEIEATEAVLRLVQEGHHEVYAVPPIQPREQGPWEGQLADLESNKG